MIKELKIRVLPKQASSEYNITQAVSQEYAIDLSSIKAIRVLKRSIDARQRQVMINMQLKVYINEIPTDDEYIHTYYGDVSDKSPVIIVGAGPAGLFAALRLIELGRRPIIIERGKNVHERRKDIARISREQIVNSESNYSFGEGGAGAFSDGKLYTRSKKRGSVDRILNIFCQHGADTSILADAHPHIGTDKLPVVIENIRKQIEKSGGEIHFETRMDKLLIKNDEIIGVETQNGKEFHAPVILATGHSARDVYYHLYESGIELESKGFAVGVRLEHPQHLIDQLQYHNPKGRGEYLPAAEYSFVAQVNGRGVYSFCMCPGGYVVNASSEQGMLAVNGMSYQARDSKNANSALIVTVTPEDFPEEGPLGGISFQRELEKRAWEIGKGKIPVQLFGDYKLHQKSSAFGEIEPQMKGAHVFADVRSILPKEIGDSIEEGVLAFGKKLKGFDRNDAILSGVESRTSSPVRIVRNREGYSNIEGIYPCGEGAGYAGGITSAAMDGIKTAEFICEKFRNF